MKIVRLAAIFGVGALQVFAEGPHRKLIISIPDRKIVLIEDGRVTHMYDVAVGKASTPSPNGSFHIANRVPHPTWYGPGQVVPPGKNNPLGTRWMGLGHRGYGIHGTNSPSSIGKAVSHGCFRMRNKDVEQLFELVSAGDTVEILKEVPPEIATLFASETVLAAAGGGD